MINAIIVEDEQSHAAVLLDQLSEVATDIHVSGIYNNIADAFEAIKTQQPELIFLDIDLDGDEEAGFRLLKKFEKPAFGVIITTQFFRLNNALRAIRASAIDFLPKPAPPEDLRHAIKKFREKSTEQNALQVQTLQRNIFPANGSLVDLCVTYVGGQTRVAVRNILYCEAADKHTKFFLAEPVITKSLSNLYGSLTQSEIVCINSLDQCKDILEGTDMCYTHRSYLVNMLHAVHYRKYGDGAKFIMKNGAEIPISRHKKDEVKKRWDDYRKRR